MYDVGALIGRSLRAVGRHVDLFWFDDDDDALQWQEWSEMVSVDNAQPSQGIRS